MNTLEEEDPKVDLKKTLIRTLKNTWAPAQKKINNLVDLDYVHFHAPFVFWLNNFKILFYFMILFY